MSKNILIFSDGTGQAGGLRPDQRLSNIYKLFRASRVAPDNIIDPKEQIAFYDAGLGTDETSTGNIYIKIKKSFDKYLGSITGRGITTNITDCYEAILNHYEPGDRIFLFGFSRGAYTVRCVARVLSLCGVPTENGQGEVLPLFTSETRKIADEAVRKVYEHGAGRDRQIFEEEREEKARRFREKYHSGINNEQTPEFDHANASPYFIGVFDTVASLGARGLRRLGMAIMAIITLVVITTSLAKILASFFEWDFWSTVVLVSLMIIAAMFRVALKSSFKIISNYPEKNSFRFHFAKWKMKNYDRGLDTRVRYARHALAIDETRKDFSRVQWGFKGSDYSRSEGEPTGLVQLWFAGNHSDIGGSYPENESRLSDITLEWMLSEARSLPHPLIVNESMLNLFPSADAMQHCEVESLRDVYPNWFPNFLRYTWPEKFRYDASGAPYHPTVHERLVLPSIIKHGRSTLYRPESLKYDPKLENFYQKS